MQTFQQFLTARRHPRSNDTLQEIRCTTATLQAFGITGACPITGAGVLTLLRQHGYHTQPRLNPDRSDGTYPLATFVRTHPHGAYYLYTTDHAMALRDGHLTDTSARARSDRIRVSVIQVTR